MLVRFVVHCAYKVLEATHVHFVVQDALKVFKIYFFGKDGLKFRLVSLTVKCLCHSRLVGLVSQFCINLHEFGIDFFLEASMITLGGWPSADLSQALHLMVRILNFVFKTSDLFIYQFKLAGSHRTGRSGYIFATSPRICRAPIKSDIALHVLKGDLFLDPEG